MIEKLKSHFLNWKFLIGLFISFYFCYIVFKDFDFINFYNTILNLNYIYIIFAFIILIFSVFLRSLRWQLLLKDEKNIPVKSLFELELIGYFGNNILPLRFGEVLRSYFLSAKYNIDIAKVFGSILLERVLDVLGLVVIILLFILPNLKELFFLNFDLSLMFIIVLIVAASISISIYFSKDKIKYSGENRLIQFLVDIFNGYSSLNVNNIYKILIYTISIWFCYWMIVYFVQYSMKLDISVLDSLVVLVVSTIAFAIPSLPGGIGVFEYGVNFSLILLGMNENVDFGILLHSITFIPYTLIGGYFYIKYYFINLDNK